LRGVILRIPLWKERWMACCTDNYCGCYCTAANAELPGSWSYSPGSDCLYWAGLRVVERAARAASMVVERVARAASRVVERVARAASMVVERVG